MQQTIRSVLFVSIAATFVACDKADVDEPAASTADEPSRSMEPVDISTAPPRVTFTPEKAAGPPAAAAAPSGPVSVSYRIIGKPVVGQPVTIDLRFVSLMGDQPVNVAYRINDPTALRLADSQPQSLSVAPAEDRGGRPQQVTIIPLREGRLYLNVAASIAIENGSYSTVTAIPIQVGDAPRNVRENGVVGRDENDEAIRSLPAQEN